MRPTARTLLAAAACLCAARLASALPPPTSYGCADAPLPCAFECHQDTLTESIDPDGFTRCVANTANPATHCCGNHVECEEKWYFAVCGGSYQMMYPLVYNCKYPRTIGTACDPGDVSN